MKLLCLWYRKRDKVGEITHGQTERQRWADVKTHMPSLSIFLAFSFFLRSLEIRITRKGMATQCGWLWILKLLLHYITEWDKMWATHSLVLNQPIFDIAMVQIFSCEKYMTLHTWRMMQRTCSRHIAPWMSHHHLDPLYIQHRPCSVLQMTRQKTQKPPVL